LYRINSVGAGSICEHQFATSQLLRRLREPPLDRSPNPHRPASPNTSGRPASPNTLRRPESPSGKPCTMAGVARTLGHAGCRATRRQHNTLGSDTSIRGHTRACVHSYGQNPPNSSCIVRDNVRSSETNLPCLPETSGTTVPLRFLGAVESH